MNPPFIGPLSVVLISAFKTARRPPGSIPFVVLERLLRTSLYERVAAPWRAVDVLFEPVTNGHLWVKAAGRRSLLRVAVWP